MLEIHSFGYENANLPKNDREGEAKLRLYDTDREMETILFNSKPRLTSLRRSANSTQISMKFD